MQGNQYAGRKLILLTAISMLSVPLVRGQSKVWTTEERNVAARDFFALVAAEDTPDVQRALASDPGLAALRSKRDAKLEAADKTCHAAACFADAMRWSSEDIAAAGAALAQSAEQNQALRHFIDVRLRPTGRFVLYEQQPAAQWIVSVWDDAANAMNRIVDTYAEGKPPLYVHIDAMQYSPASPEWVHFLEASVATVSAEQNALPTFFSSTMKLCSLLLVANDRPDAGRYEPLASENHAAILRSHAINWSRYPYSVIVVPGEGPEVAGVALSPLGRIRVEKAVGLYRQGKAPFLLVSGGTVHPMLTKFDEAIEMRKELIEQWGVPASAILIDPYARHTTTNLRNAAREVLRYAFPKQKPMLIASDAAQVAMILSPAFEARCQREMHLVPWVRLESVSPTEASMLPRRDALQEDAVDDPLDP